MLEESDGSRAIGVFQSLSGAVDLLLTDVEMSPMTGYELASKLQSIKEGLKVIYMSGLPLDPRFVSRNAAFLAKPFRPPDAHLKEVWQMLRKP